MKSIQNYFALIYIFVLIAIIGMGIYYLNDLPEFARQQIPGTVTVSKDSIKAPTTDFTETKGSISPPVDIYKLAVSTPDQIEKGKTLFSTTCSSCHGTEGKGDGVAGASLNPKPRNFTSLDGWKNGPKLTQMYKTLQEGIANSGMASFANVPPEERIAVIHYIQQTFIKTFPQSSADEIKELDKTYGLTAGIKQPNIIPIKSAEEKVIKDNEAVTKKVSSLKELVEKSSSDSAALLFKSVTNNLTKALTVLASDPGWQANENQLYNLIGTNPVSNGFRGRAATLGPKEVSMIYAYLKNLFAGYKG